MSTHPDARLHQTTPSSHIPFADRINDVPRSFIREILKVAIDPTVISFAGGLPNRELFPVDDIRNATDRVLTASGPDLLQYGSSEGYPPLREYIASTYRERFGLDIPVERVLVTSGSQQGLDLLGKILVNEGDPVAIEEPGYLGAIQALSIYRPRFLPVPVSETGMDLERLAVAARAPRPKLLYTVPNFQNPSGVSYPESNRRSVAELVGGSGIYLIEDDPYGELRFKGSEAPSFGVLVPERSVLLGSFSKTVVPGFRLGWIVAPEELMQKLIIAKQATDLHTSHFTQAIVHEFVTSGALPEHLSRIRASYGAQCRAMIAGIASHFPPGVTHTNPTGGMFLWATLPDGIAAIDLFDAASKDGVVFVPGDPFYIDRNRVSTLRLNFSCVDEPTIEEGIRRLGDAIRDLTA